MPGFEHYVSVAASRCRSRYRIVTVSVQAVHAVAAGPVRGISAAGPGVASSRRVAWRTNGRYEEIELDPMNG